MRDGSVLLLAGEFPSTRMVYHGLRAALPATVSLQVILEGPVVRSQLLRRRLSRLGAVTVAGQLLFMTFAVPVLRWRGRRRIESIHREHGLVDAPIPEPVHRVRSANSPEARDLLRSLEPTLVVINGTRILGAVTLAATGAPFINMHAGITPAYRGVHGGYWALVDGRLDRVGTTIHRVDEGIDTGSIIDQAVFAITPEDNFCTYPYLHVAAGLPLLSRAVVAALEGDIQRRQPAAEMASTLRYHPTLWTYLAGRLRHGAK